MASKGREALVEAAADAMRQTMMAMRFGGRGFRTAADGKHHMSPVSWVVLRLIRKTDDPTPSSLAQRMGVTPATVTGILNRLEEAGFVKRIRDTSNRRIVHLEATAKADQGMKRSRAQWVSSASKVFSVLDDDELSTLISLLQRSASTGTIASPDGTKQP